MRMFDKSVPMWPSTLISNFWRYNRSKCKLELEAQKGTVEEIISRFEVLLQIWALSGAPDQVVPDLLYFQRT